MKLEEKTRHHPPKRRAPGFLTLLFHFCKEIGNWKCCLYLNKASLAVKPVS